MKKYKIYHRQYTDTILAKRWDYYSNYHRFYNESDELICHYPMQNTIIEVESTYSEMKQKLEDTTLTGDTSNNITKTNVDGKINHNVCELQ
jgi:hypothetical protein